MAGKKLTQAQRWEAEGLTDNRGSNNFPNCKGCIFAEDGEKGYQKAFCAVYPRDGAEFKPQRLYAGGECEYYDEAEELQSEIEAVWEEVELFKKRAASGYYSSDEEMIAAERRLQKKLNEVHKRIVKMESEKNV
jgi:hypothetical protein